MKKFILLLVIFLHYPLSFERDGAIYGRCRIEHKIVLAESPFSNTKTTWTKEFQDSILNFKATGQFVALFERSADGRKLHFFDLEKGTEWMIAHKEYPIYWYYIVGNDNPKLMVEGMRHESIFETNVFDQSGSHLFKLITRGKVMPTPNGKYYYTDYNMASWTNLEVYDARGELLWTASTSKGDWFVKALSDSELIYIDGADLVLYEFGTGEKIWKIQSFLNEYSDMVVSRNGRDFIIFDTNDIYFANREGVTKWIRNDLGYLYSVAISDNGSFTVVHSRSKNYKNKSTLTLLKNDSGGKSLWQQEINETSLPSGLENLKFHNEYIELIPDAVNYFHKTGITEDMKTYIYKINTKNGKLISSYVLPGNVQLIEENGQVIGYYQLQVISGKKVISKIEAVP